MSFFVIVFYGFILSFGTLDSHLKCITSDGCS